MLAITSMPFAIIFVSFLKEIIGGSLKIWQSSGCYEFEVGYTHEKYSCSVTNTFIPLSALSTVSPSVQAVTKEDEVVIKS